MGRRMAGSNLGEVDGMRLVLRLPGMSTLGGKGTFGFKILREEAVGGNSWESW